MKKLSVHLKNLVIVYFNTYLIIMVASYAMTGISRDEADILRMHSLLLLPAYLYLIRTRIHHLLPFILAHLLAVAPILIYALPGNIYGMVIMGAAIAIFVFHSFVLKLTDTKNETSVGGALVLCGAMTVGYFCADIQGFEIGPLVHPYLMGAAAAMILLFFIDMHTRNVDSTLNNVNEMLNQPAQKIRRFNNKILIYFVAATAVFVILALVFRLDRVIVAVGNALLWIIRFLVSLIPHGQTVREESSIIAEESSKASGDTIQLVGGEAAAIWEFLEMIVTIAVFAALIIGLLYGLYRFYKWFYSRKMGEVVADEYEESSVYMEKEEKAVRRREPILERFRMTNEKRIRRMYRKRLEEPMKKEQIHPSDAPGEILQILPSEELKTLTPLYEKARYSQNPISKEELKKAGG